MALANCPLLAVGNFPRSGKRFLGRVDQHIVQESFDYISPYMLAGYGYRPTGLPT